MKIRRSVFFVLPNRVGVFRSSQNMPWLRMRSIHKILIFRYRTFTKWLFQRNIPKRDEIERIAISHCSCLLWWQGSWFSRTIIQTFSSSISSDFDAVTQSRTRKTTFKLNFKLKVFSKLTGGKRRHKRWILQTTTFWTLFPKRSFVTSSIGANWSRRSVSQRRARGFTPSHGSTNIGRKNVWIDGICTRGHLCWIMRLCITITTTSFESSNLYQSHGSRWQTASFIETEVPHFGIEVSMCVSANTIRMAISSTKNHI